MGKDRTRGSKSNGPIVTKLSPEEIFDGLRDPENENVFLTDGTLDGQKVVFVASERSSGEIVPLALLLDKKGAKAIIAMEEELIRRDEEEGSEEDEDGDEGEDEGFDP